MADNKRLNLVGEVADVYSRIMSAERGEVPATVTTASPLDPTQKKNLTTALTKFLNKGEKLILHEEVTTFTKTSVCYFATT